jgi:RNA polymerase sigma-70 factor (ECF subfamily)
MGRNDGQLNETDLIHRAQRGDADAFGALYGQYADAVYAFVWSKTHHRETAEDLTAQSFTKALEHIGSLTAGANAFRPWVYTIARNTVIDHYRTHRQHRDIEDAWDLASGDDVARDAAARMQLARVRELLEGMDPVQRDVVLLRVWSDLPYADIAAIVGRTPEHCKVIFSRVARKLRTELALLLLLVLPRFLR